MTVKTYDSLSIQIQLSRFAAKHGVTEYHVMATVTNPELSFNQQVENLRKAYSALMEEEETRLAIPVFRRYFLSDAANQADAVME